MGRHQFDTLCNRVILNRRENNTQGNRFAKERRNSYGYKHA